MSAVEIEFKLRKANFGHKLISRMDIDGGLNAKRDHMGSHHDGYVDLLAESEVIFRDKWYFDVKAKGVDFAIKYAVG
jgi:hypothetical protein